MLVEYVVFLQTSSEEIGSETLDFINLQSNMVEGTYGDSSQPTVQHTMINPHSYITDALNGTALPVCSLHWSMVHFNMEWFNVFLFLEETSTEEANSATEPGREVNSYFCQADNVDCSISTRISSLFC